MATPPIRSTRGRMLRVLVAFASVLGALVTMTATAQTAQAATLWQCTDPLYPDKVSACTRITSAPSSGVQVWDRTDGRVFTLHNGDSVALWYWYIDTSGQCGINGDKYVWLIKWTTGTGGVHLAYIGDYYLATGPVSTWNDFTDSHGNLGNDYHFQGYGSGECDVFE